MGALSKLQLPVAQLKEMLTRGRVRPDSDGEVEELGGIQVLRKGGGCYGSLYLGELHGRPVAAKMFKGLEDSSPEESYAVAICDADQEAQALFKARAREVFPRVEAFFTGSSAFHPFIVYNYFNLCSLDHVLENTDLLKSPVALAHAVMEVLRLVSFLMEIGILHKDIKPENILVSRGANGLSYRLADAGLAREYGPVDEKARRVGNVFSKTPEEFLYGELAPTSDLIGLVFIPFPIWRNMIVKSLADTTRLSQLVTAQGKEHGFIATNQVHLLVHWVLLAVVCTMLQIDPSQRSTGHKLFLVAHGAFEVLAAETKKVSQLVLVKLELQLLTRLADPEVLGALGPDLREALLRQYQCLDMAKEAFSAFCSGDEAETYDLVEPDWPLPQILTLEELKAVMDSTPLPASDDYVGYEQNGASGNTLGFCTHSFSLTTIFLPAARQANMTPRAFIKEAAEAAGAIIAGTIATMDPADPSFSSHDAAATAAKTLRWVFAAPFYTKEIPEALISLVHYCRSLVSKLRASEELLATEVALPGSLERDLAQVLVSLGAVQGLWGCKAELAAYGLRAAQEAQQRGESSAGVIAFLTVQLATLHIVKAQLIVLMRSCAKEVPGAAAKVDHMAGLAETTIHLGLSLVGPFPAELPFLYKIVEAARLAAEGHTENAALAAYQERVQQQTPVPMAVTAAPPVEAPAVAAAAAAPMMHVPGVFVVRADGLVPVAQAAPSAQDLPLPQGLALRTQGDPAEHGAQQPLQQQQHEEEGGVVGAIGRVGQEEPAAASPLPRALPQPAMLLQEVGNLDQPCSPPKPAKQPGKYPSPAAAWGQQEQQQPQQQAAEQAGVRGQGEAAATEAILPAAQVQRPGGLSLARLFGTHPQAPFTFGAEAREAAGGSPDRRRQLAHRATRRQSPQQQAVARGLGATRSMGAGKPSGFGFNQGLTGQLLEDCAPCNSDGTFLAVAEDNLARVLGHLSLGCSEDKTLPMRPLLAGAEQPDPKARQEALPGVALALASFNNTAVGGMGMEEYWPQLSQSLLDAIAQGVRVRSQPGIAKSPSPSPAAPMLSLEPFDLAMPSAPATRTTISGLIELLKQRGPTAMLGQPAAGSAGWGEAPAWQGDAFRQQAAAEGAKAMWGRVREQQQQQEQGSPVQLRAGAKRAVSGPEAPQAKRSAVAYKPSDSCPSLRVSARSTSRRSSAAGRSSLILDPVQQMLETFYASPVFTPILRSSNGEILIELSYGRNYNAFLYNKLGYNSYPTFAYNPSINAPKYQYYLVDMLEAKRDRLLEALQQDPELLAKVCTQQGVQVAAWHQHCSSVEGMRSSLEICLSDDFGSREVEKAGFTVRRLRPEGRSNMKQCAIFSPTESFFSWDPEKQRGYRRQIVQWVRQEFRYGITKPVQVTRVTFRINPDFAALKASGSWSTHTF